MAGRMGRYIVEAPNKNDESNQADSSNTVQTIQGKLEQLSLDPSQTGPATNERQGRSKRSRNTRNTRRNAQRKAARDKELVENPDENATVSSVLANLDGSAEEKVDLVNERGLTPVVEAAKPSVSAGNSPQQSASEPSHSKNDSKPPKTEIAVAETSDHDAVTPSEPVVVLSNDVTFPRSNKTADELAHMEMFDMENRNIIIPSPDYLRQANRPPVQSPYPQPLLVICDINGVLLFRAKSHLERKWYVRPGINKLFNYAVTWHRLMFWTSAMHRNTTRMLNKIMPDSGTQRLLVDVWSRSELGLSNRDYLDKVPVYKRLERVWQSDSIQRQHPYYDAGARWGQHNTVLVEDSPDKAVTQPHNVMLVSEFTGEEEEETFDPMGEVVTYLEWLKYQPNVSAAMRAYPFVPGFISQHFSVEATMELLGLNTRE